MKLTKLLMLFALSSATSSFAQDVQRLENAVTSEHRTEHYVLRDEFRNPVQTLQAFGIEPTDRVLEIWPGSGWYTEILAPYLREQGELVVAHFPTESEVAYYMTLRMNFEEKLAANPSVYDRVSIVSFSPDSGIMGVEDASFDGVLTFRNVHNWLRGGNEQRVFSDFFRVLKPGGTLGVVEHRSHAEMTRDEMIRSGYMTEAYVIQVAEAAGFELVEVFDVNANPRDTADHEGGVWALPPTLTNGEEEEERYIAIGESDRMTLRFRKPE